MYRKVLKPLCPGAFAVAEDLKKMQRRLDQDKENTPCENEEEDTAECENNYDEYKCSFCTEKYKINLCIFKCTECDSSYCEICKWKENNCCVCQSDISENSSRDYQMERKAKVMKSL